MSADAKDDGLSRTDRECAEAFDDPAHEKFLAAAVYAFERMVAATAPDDLPRDLVTITVPRAILYGAYLHLEYSITRSPDAAHSMNALSTAGALRSAELASDRASKGKAS